MSTSILAQWHIGEYKDREIFKHVAGLLDTKVWKRQA